jgi:hypothetical protein
VREGDVAGPRAELAEESLGPLVWRKLDTVGGRFQPHVDEVLSSLGLAD